MIRFRLYFDKDKETAWLNRMAEDGYALQHYFLGFYDFAPCEKGEYIYQIDFGRGFFSVEESYREFLSEMDTDIVALWGPWVILSKKAADGPFELYSDVDSAIEHYTKIRNAFKVCAILECVCFILEAICVANGFTAGYLLLLPLAALALVLGAATFRTNDRINRLRQQRGEADSEPPLRSSSPVPLALVLMAGLLLHMVARLIPEEMSNAYDFLHGFMDGAAIALMLLGVYLVGRRLRK